MPDHPGLQEGPTLQSLSVDPQKAGPQIWLAASYTARCWPQQKLHDCCAMKQHWIQHKLHESCAKNSHGVVQLKTEPGGTRLNALQARGKLPTTRSCLPDVLNILTCASQVLV